LLDGPRALREFSYPGQGMTDSEDESTTRARARIGKVLRDKWKLYDLLGLGGMAAVYAASHVNNGKRVAIKLLHPEVLSNAEARSRFLREGYVANKVGHPGTVQVLDDDTDEDGSVFLVMELLEGESFETRRARSRHVLSAIDVLKVADRVLDVLASAHEKGIVHRDIKPDNIFLTSDGGVKLLDFGIARLRDSMRRATMTSGGAIGTPAFMPPEQARGRWDDVGPRTDIWALGATMFTALTGRLVHEAETVNELLLAAMTKPAPPLSSILPGVPSAVATVVDRALAHDMDARWSDARTMQTMVRMAFQALGDPAGGGAGRWGGTLRMPNGGATSELGGPPPSVAQRGSIPALGGMMAVPLVAPPRASIPSLPAVPFQMADPLTGRVPAATPDSITSSGRAPAATPDRITGSGRALGASPDRITGSGRISGMMIDPAGTGQHQRIDPIGTGQHQRIDPIGTGQHPMVRIDPVGTGQHPMVRLDPNQRPPTPQFASGGFSTAASAQQGMSTGQPVMLGAPKPAKSYAALIIAALGVLLLVIGVGIFFALRRAPAPETPEPAVAPSTPEPSALPVLSATAAPDTSAAPKPAATAPEPSATSTSTASPSPSTKTPRKTPVIKKR
jgi:eukaryotic-like serine/threonine-protein kinase